jgi:hypothetical protein
VESHKFVFVCGLHKSGTSILFQCLRSHPATSGFSQTGVPEDEGQHLQTVYPPAWAFGGMGKFGFHPEAHLTETSPLVTAANRQKLFAEWEQYWDVEKPVLLEKSPPNLIRTRFLQAMFPNSYFVIVTRHPLAVSYATKKRRLQELKLDKLLRHWLACHDMFNEDKCHLEKALVLNYESFVKNPNDSLKRIYHFIGIDNYPNNLKIHSDINGKYFTKWRGFRENMLFKSYANHLVNKYEQHVNRHGYSLRELDGMHLD